MVQHVSHDGLLPCADLVLRLDTAFDIFDHLLNQALTGGLFLQDFVCAEQFLTNIQGNQHRQTLRFDAWHGRAGFAHFAVDITGSRFERFGLFGIAGQRVATIKDFQFNIVQDDCSIAASAAAAGLTVSVAAMVVAVAAAVAAAVVAAAG